MVVIIWLVVGGIVGWLASIVMRTDAQQGIVLNVVVGVVGAAVAGLIFDGGTINETPLSIGAFAVSLLGSIAVLAVVNLIRKGSIR